MILHGSIWQKFAELHSRGFSHMGPQPKAHGDRNDRHDPGADRDPGPGQGAGAKGEAECTAYLAVHVAG